MAIKVLPTAVAQDPERLTRFEREAKVLASLNHPNIAHLYGFEENGANMMIFPEGVVKVLDLGLASVPSSETGSDPTNSNAASHCPLNSR